MQQRLVKHQQDLDTEWAETVRQRPGCEGLFSCIQCGTCSATCPLTDKMDLTPRQIISMTREGMREEVLQSDTIWLCASCYSCAVECPRDISITNIMYALKREAMKEGKYPKRFPIPALANAFYSIVRKRGRNEELPAVMKMAMKSDPTTLLKMGGTGIDLMRTGRFHFRGEKIKGIKQLQAMLNGRDEE